MQQLILGLALLLSAASAAADEDSTGRYWPHGPAWYDTPCGLACFQAWQRLGLEAADASAAEVRRFQSTADVQLVAGNRRRGQGTFSGSYPDDDLRALLVDGKWKFVHKDGTAY